MFKKSRTSNNNWVEFSQSYLLLARLACQEIVDERQTKHQRIENVINGTFSYDPRDIFIPVIYNIKHGIEIFTKSLNIIQGLPYNASSHNIKKLFDDIEENIPNIQEKEYADGNTITQEMVNNLPNDIEKLKTIIKKYHHVELGVNFGIDAVIDEKNDMFRYPDNSAQVTTDIETMLQSVDSEKMQEILNDINQLYNLFNSIGYIYDVAKNST